MKSDDIKRPLDYHYKRQIGAVVQTGKGEVQEVKYIPGWGSLILLLDKARDKVLRLRPAHIVRRVNRR